MVVPVLVNPVEILLVEDNPAMCTPQGGFERGQSDHSPNGIHGWRGGTGLSAPRGVLGQGRMPAPYRAGPEPSQERWS
jgi:hypothetical protein